MGRLTEILDTAQNGFAEPETYHWIEPKDEKTRNTLILMRKIGKKVDNEQKMLF